MSASAVESEARGQEYIEATFRGGRFTLPLDVDSWPLDNIRSCLGLHPETLSLTINRVQLAAALQELLGGQWPAFCRVAPKGRHLAPASNLFAKAAGFPAGDGDKVFGGIPKLLARLERWPEHIESDLDRFWGIDYRDRFRFDDDGRRRLTLRQIYARLVEPPRESRLSIAANNGKEPVSGTAIAVMDLWEVWTRKRHPSRPMSKEEIAARDAQAQQDERDAVKHRARQEARNKRLGRSSHLDNARANALRTQGREVLNAQDEDTD